MSDKWKVFMLLGLAVVSASIGEALSSKGMKQAQEAGNVLAVLQAAAQDWHVIVGVLLLFAYVFLYVYALGLADLSFAIPLLAFSYLFGLISSRFYLHEDIKPGRLIGTIIIIGGVLTVAFTGQGGGDKDKDKQKGDQPDKPQAASGSDFHADPERARALADISGKAQPPGEQAEKQANIGDDPD